MSTPRNTSDLHDVHLEHEKSWEESGGYQDQISETTYVGLDASGQAWRIMHRKVTKFAPRSSGTSADWMSPDKIDAAEYEAVATKAAKKK